MKAIVVRVITYNQENVISRALDSVLCQKEWGLYRIVVSDDCSQDRTWEILQEYKTKYPAIMEIHRNEHNLGIYGNVNKSEEYLPTKYDLFTGLAGDDVFCNGYFEKVQKLIEENHIDTDEAVGFYFDWKAVYPNGEETIFRQSAVLTGHNLWSLYIRGLISGRSLMISKSVHDAHEPILNGRGLNLTESHWDSQSHLNIKRAYYCPFVASAYYTGIGVSTRLSTKYSNYHTDQEIEKWQYFSKFYVTNEKDRLQVQYAIEKANYFKHPTFGRIVKVMVLFYRAQLQGCRSSFKAMLRFFINLLRVKFKI